MKASQHTNGDVVERDLDEIAPPLIGSEGSEGTSADEGSLVLDPQSMEWSRPFVGRWQQLISQTNWEKGKIIHEWRSALVTQSSSVTAYSDESWAKQVGAVTSQHVGRLRRVYERFGSSCESYPRLFWSHFLAAIDWDDAELWLEGAAQSHWSVSQMRRTRNEAMGQDPDASEREVLIDSELDDGFVALSEDDGAIHVDTMDEGSTQDGSDRSTSGPLNEGPDFGEEGQGDGSGFDSDPASSRSQSEIDGLGIESGSLNNPFAGLGEMPPDVSDALEQFKLCIIRHRANHWTDISQTQLLSALEALRHFANR
ncbi:MAG: hypothetical protein WCI02_10315 [Planctomycetota bacterium]